MGEKRDGRKGVRVIHKKPNIVKVSTKKIESYKGGFNSKGENEPDRIPGTPRPYMVIPNGKIIKPVKGVKVVQVYIKRITNESKDNSDGISGATRPYMNQKDKERES